MLETSRIFFIRMRTGDYIYKHLGSGAKTGLQHLPILFFNELLRVSFKDSVYCITTKIGIEQTMGEQNIIEKHPLQMIFHKIKRRVRGFVGERFFLYYTLAP